MLLYGMVVWWVGSGQCPAGRVFQYWVGYWTKYRVVGRGRVGFRSGSGRVRVGFGSGSGRVGVLKYTIGYFWVSFLLSDISGCFGYFRVCRVFSGILGLPISTRITF